MHRALGIPEVLGIIFRYTTASTDARCARVHRAWREEALDALWYRVDSLEAFLYVLGPTRSNEYKERALVSTSVTLESWDRFVGYSKRVKTICLSGRSNEVESQSMAIIGTLGQSDNIFPHLRHLFVDSYDIQWNASIVQLFLQKSLHTVSITICDSNDIPEGDSDLIEDEEAATCRLLPFIARRSPDVTHLSIHNSGAFLKRYHMALAELILSLPNLRFVDIPSAAVTSHMAVVNALITCSRLQVLCAEGRAATRTLLSSPPLLDIIFLNLTELSLEDNFGSIGKILRSSFPASRLRKLHATHKNPEPVGVFASFIQAVGESCPDLEDLAIMRLPLRAANDHQLPSDSGVDSEAGSVTFSLLAPLKSCGKLLHCTLNTSVPVETVRKDFKALIASWPLLRTCTIIYPGGKSKCLNAGDVNELARSCLHLEELSLVVDFSKRPAPDNRASFRCLRTLRLASCAKVHSTTDCAMLLVHSTKPYCAILPLPAVAPWGDHDARRRSRSRNGKPGDAVIPRARSVEEVLSVVPSMRAIQAHYQAELRTRDEAVLQYRVHIDQLQQRLGQMAQLLELQNAILVQRSQSELDRGARGTEAGPAACDEGVVETSVDDPGSGTKQL